MTLAGCSKKRLIVPVCVVKAPLFTIDAAEDVLLNGKPSVAERGIASTMDCNDDDRSKDMGKDDLELDGAKALAVVLVCSSEDIVPVVLLELLSTLEE